MTHPFIPKWQLLKQGEKGNAHFTYQNAHYSLFDFKLMMEGKIKDTVIHGIKRLSNERTLVFHVSNCDKYIRVFKAEDIPSNWKEGMNLDVTVFQTGD